MSKSLTALVLLFGLAACATARPGPVDPAPAQAQPQPRPGAPAQAAAPTEVNQDALIQKEFLDRVAKYVELRKAEEGKLPKLGDDADPKAIAQHQQALLKALQHARSGAQAGDLFTPPARALIRRLVAPPTARPNSPPREAIEEENPGKIRIAVNSPYPTTVPLPTVPPQVLAALPRLPDEQLEFRFVGQRLILLDAKANMIVDYMERALP